MHIGSPPNRPERPAELEDWLNRRVFHPASWRLARLLEPTAITPNMVSVAGAILVMAAAFCYSLSPMLVAIVAGFAVHLSWHVVDGADGDLARLTSRSSPRGELVDGLCDIAGHIVLYLVLGSLAAEQIGAALAWFLAISAGASRLIQAAHYEGFRRQYQEIVYGTPWLGNNAGGQPLQESRNPLVVLYRRVLAFSAPQARILALASQSQAKAAQVAASLRAEAHRLLAPMAPLCANYRTIAAGLAMLAGRPHWFFLFEVVALNLVLAISAVNLHRRIDRMLADQISPARTRR